MQYSTHVASLDTHQVDKSPQVVDMSFLGQPLKAQLMELGFGQDVLVLQRCQDEAVWPSQGTTTDWLITRQHIIHDCFAAWPQAAQQGSLSVAALSRVRILANDQWLEVDWGLRTS